MCVLRLLHPPFQVFSTVSDTYTGVTTMAGKTVNTVTCTAGSAVNHVTTTTGNVVNSAKSTAGTTVDGVKVCSVLCVCVCFFIVAGLNRERECTIENGLALERKKGKLTSCGRVRILQCSMCKRHELLQVQQA